MDPLTLKHESELKYKHDRLSRVIIVLWIVSAIAVIPMAIGIIYIACHFIAKVW